MRTKEERIKELEKDEEEIKNMMESLLKRDLVRMFRDISERYNHLIKFLYKNYKPILREWESIRSNLKINFGGIEH